MSSSSSSVSFGAVLSTTSRMVMTGIPFQFRCEYSSQTIPTPRSWPCHIPINCYREGKFDITLLDRAHFSMRRCTIECIFALAKRAHSPGVAIAYPWHMLVLRHYRAHADNLVAHVQLAPCQGEGIRAIVCRISLHCLDPFA